MATGLDGKGAATYIPIGMKYEESPQTVHEADDGTEAQSCAVAVARGRPRQFDPEKALTAALQVFWQRGYEGASIAELTEAMGITKPSLYACFGNKESLFRKALDLYERDKLAYARNAMNAPTAKGVAEQMLRGALSLQIGTNDPRACLGVMSAVACTTFDDSIRDEVMARRASADHVILERFRRAEAEGDLPAGVTPEALAAYLMAVMQGMGVQAASGASSEQLTQLVETTLALWPGR